MNSFGNVGAAIARVAKAGGTRVDPPTLMPAETILELSGEVVRGRLCIFTDAAGRELCLRPDLTTPIADRVASGELAVGRYHASGPVYRLQPRGSRESVEHIQVGFEWFGQGGSLDEDAEALAVALEAAQAGGVKTAEVRFGDVAIYRAVISALPLTDQWRDRLRRGFTRRKGPRELLEAARRGEMTVPAMAAGLAALPVRDAVAAVEAMMTALNVVPVGGRGPEEIVERLRDKAVDKTPDAAATSALNRYLDITSPADGSLKALEAFAREAGVDIGGALEGFRQRLARLSVLKPPFWGSALFQAEAGRRFEYYDGFVFELVRRQAEDRPIVSGGRYDGLVSRLSGKARTASAIGAALRADRLGEGGA